MKKLQLWMVVLSFLAFAASAAGQIQNGQFTGIVTDPSGAAVGNAKITVTSAATGLTVTTTTNSSGSYTLKELPVGIYKITAEAAGFKTVSNANVTLNAGAIAHVDFKMELGQAREVVEVMGEASAVQTEDAKLYSTVGSTEISSYVLNGRNVFDLTQLSTGAVNVNGIDFENGHNTVVNGVREDFNGYLINGVSNKGLSGGPVNTPIQDTVEEFQELGLNMSAQYGNSAGSSINLVTKSGTNQFHGSAWEYNRNDTFNANTFLLNQAGVPRQAQHWNQFGFTFGGPIVKDKLFFFLSYQGSRFTTVLQPSSIAEETPQWRQAVAQADSNTSVQSTANLLYSKFPTTLPGTALYTIDEYIANVSPTTTSGFGSYADYLCPDSYGPNGMGGSAAQAGALARRMQSILGVVPGIDNAANLALTGAPCSTPMVGQAGTIGRNAVTGVSGMPFQLSSVAISKSQAVGNLFNGNEYTGKIDFNWNSANRLSANFNWSRTTDLYGPCGPSCTRGFGNPTVVRTPNGQLSWVHTFTPTVLNELRVGYSQNVNPLTSVSLPGVPQTSFDDGSVGFGSYNGYPQFFKENVYTYSDMVSVSHGNHNIKIGADFRRNIENSQFDIARGSYYFSDPIFFAADSPYTISVGVNPGICAAPCPQSDLQNFLSSNTVPNAQLESNVRHWRNLEVGAYFQDDWKVTKRLTLQLGLRWDLYTRHNELNNKATTFIPGPGGDILQQLIHANVKAGSTGTINGTTYDCTSNASQALSQLAGVCGPGGFAPSDTLGKGRYKDFGPRLGFAWDVFGDGKTSVRGGFGIAYEGTLYNPLSNSRWNLPYYSFNNVTNFIGGDVNTLVWGPTSCTPSVGCTPTGGALFGPGGVTPTFSGPPTNPNQGSGFQATGNINGWYGQSPNLALLTGIIFPQGVDDPYVYNYYFGVQRQIMPKTIVEFNYVGTTGHKLFRAEDINRAAGTLLPAGATLVNNVGITLTGYGHRPNANYGRLRVWENVVNSNYNSLQAAFKRQMSHGLLLNVNYTFSHSIDNGSTWHSGSTTANAAAAGEGFTTDPQNPALDRGNSIYDIRQRLVINHVWQLPGQNMKGALGYIAGGWSLNGIWSFQTGPHWQPFRAGAQNLRNAAGGHCSVADVEGGNCVNKGGDYLLTRGRNERPDSSLSTFGGVSRSTWGNGWCPGGVLSHGPCALGTYNQAGLPVFTAPCLGCVGNLGRNQFVGPGQWQADLTLSKNFKLTERFNLKFDAAAFNVFNRVNYLLATNSATTHNEIRDSLFGKAGGTLDPRTMQFGLKLSF